MEAATSTQQSINVNAKSSYEAVPVEYMNCNTAAFEEGDSVLVEFTDQDKTMPKVIGFKEEPMHCGGFMLIISSPSGEEAFVWNIVDKTLLIEKKSLAEIQSELNEMGYSSGTESVPNNSVEEVWDTEEDPVYLDVKLNQPFWYTGYYADYDPDYEEGRPTVHGDAQLVSGEVWQWEWNYPYIEYTHPITGELEIKSAYPIRKNGLFDVEDFPTLELGEPCDGEPETETIGWFRYYFWFHSIFGVEIEDYYPTQDFLDLTQDWLFETWYSAYWDMYEGSCSTYYNWHWNFGIAKNSSGVILTEFIDTCSKWDWGDTETCLDRYDKTTDERMPRIFRVYSVAKEQLEGLAKECFDAVNTERESQGIDPVVMNAALTEAAERHANDLVANFDVTNYSHTGSDESSPTDRVVDAEYTLWMHGIHETEGGENIAVNNMNDPVAQAMASWESSTEGHWENLLNSDWDETGIAVIHNPEDGMYTFVQVFCYRTGTWPGFSPVNTEEILEYMDNNFNWNGTGDETHVPKIYLA